MISLFSAGIFGIKKSNNVVACAGGRVKSEENFSSVGKSALSHVMDFLPMRLAFGEFCRKSLCSEVRRCIERCAYCKVRANSGCDGWFFRTFFALNFVVLRG